MTWLNLDEWNRVNITTVGHMHFSALWWVRRNIDQIKVEDAKDALVAYEN